MKELFVEKRFGAESRSLIDTINTILAEYVAAGYDLSVRQLYYQLVSRNIVPNTERSYKTISKLVSEARLAGLIDWEVIKDRGRECVTNSHWDSPADIVRSAAHSFRIDRWKDQPCYVEVMVEKQALEGVLIPVCRDLDVPFTANKGYSSSSTLYEASKRYLVRSDKQLFVLYLGDHDPSGIDMTRDVSDRMDTFTQFAGIEVQRLALNMDQVDELHPPENPAKMTDSRASDYVRKFGQSSWELDAIEPKRLAELVRHAINEIINVPLWNKSGKLQEEMRKDLFKYSEQYSKKNK